MAWLVLLLIAAFLWTQRQSLGLRLPGERSLVVAALTVLAMLAARSGKLPVALGLGVLALGAAYLWRKAPLTGGERQPPAAEGARMTPAEAYAVLQLPPGAGLDEIKQAHRRLMKFAHPDRGGSNYKAARLNQAKDILMGRK